GGRRACEFSQNRRGVLPKVWQGPLQLRHCGRVLEGEIGALLLGSHAGTAGLSSASWSLRAWIESVAFAMVESDLAIAPRQSARTFSMASRSSGSIASSRSRSSE